MTRQRLADAACWLAIFMLACVFVVSLTFLKTGKAWAHELHHHEATVNYNNWVNNEDKGCCNNQDCRPAADTEVRYSPRTEVKIEGKWCPVLSKHYLKKGNAPDWNTNHVCVRIEYAGDDMGGTPAPATDPCERLLCFQPKPMY